MWHFFLTLEAWAATPLAESNVNDAGGRQEPQLRQQVGVEEAIEEKHQNGIGIDARVAQCGKVIAPILPYGEIKCDGVVHRACAPKLEVQPFPRERIEEKHSVLIVFRINGSPCKPKAAVGPQQPRTRRPAAVPAADNHRIWKKWEKWHYPIW